MGWKNLSRSQRVAGLATLAAMLLAVVLDNSRAPGRYETVHRLPMSVRVGEFAIDKPLIPWINEGASGAGITSAASRSRHRL